MAKQIEMKGQGFENDPDPEIEKAIAHYEYASEEAAKFKTTKDRRRDELIAKLQAKKITRYRSKKRNVEILLESNAALKTLKLKAPKEDGEGDDGEE